MDDRMVATLGVDINRPADEVFEYLRDVHHHNDVEVTAFEPGRKIEFTATQDGHKFLNTFVLTPYGDKTRVDKTIDFFKPGGFAGMFVMPILLPGPDQADDPKGARHAEGST